MMDEETMRRLREDWDKVVPAPDDAEVIEDDGGDETESAFGDGDVVRSETLYGCPEDELDGTMSVEAQIVDFGEDHDSENFRYVVAVVDDENNIITENGFDDLEAANNCFDDEKKDFYLRSEANRIDIRDQHAEAVADLSDEWLASSIDAQLLSAVAVIIGRAQSESVLALLKEHDFA